MLTAITTVFTLLTSGAGGGLLGGIFGLFKQKQEKDERVEMARIAIERDSMEYENAQKERDHALTMLNAGAQVELERVETEGEVAIELSHQEALSEAQGVFKNLNTSTGMDNYRASVRPTIAYWATGLFSIMLIWAFFKYGHLITDGKGLQILIGLFATLTFTVTSVISFYYVSRRNAAPKL